MKLRKILSLVVMTTMIMACSVFTSMPTAFAASDEYNETFDGFELTSTAGGQATMTSLKTAGWYPVDNKKTYSLSYSNTNYQFVEVVADENDSSNHYLKISTPNIGNNNEQYGLGRLLKSGKTSVTGNWKIEFDFKACPVGGKAQFNFGLNTYSTDTNFSATDAQHNIISAFNNKMYLGYRNYRTLYDNGVEQGTIGSGLNFNWYHVKAIVNCDARYYSVELSQPNKGTVRRSAISFAGDETIGFLKLSALGMGGVTSSVYVDNVSIAPTTREKLIYNETFGGYGNVKLATSGVTTGNAAEDVSGDSYFGVGSFTPWRAFKDSEGNIFKNYGLVDNDATLNSKVVRLGDDTETTDTTEASGLVYMPALEKLVTSANQSTRGKVKVSFKIKPSVIGSTNVSVNAIADHTQDIANDSARIFLIGKDSGGTPILYKDQGTQTLNASKWYDIDLVFDVVNKTVETKLTEHGTTRSISFSNTHSYLTALKGIMFKVNGGSSVLMDDIKLEYYEPAPVIGTVSLTDMFGNTVTANTNVSPALEKIVIPVGCTLDNSTASASTIKLTDSHNTEITYEPSRADNAYTLILNSNTLSTILEPNETYTITVPATLANFLGDTLGTAYTYTFTTGSMPRLMDIGSVKIDGNANATLSDINVGSTINVAVNYANSTNAAINGTTIVVFYGGGRVIRALTNDMAVAAGEYGTDNSTFEFTVPAELNMSDVDKVSVFLWDGFTDITPYCPEVSFE